MKPIRKELQEIIEESFESDYVLKTDEEIIEMITEFGFGEMEIHSVDINRIIVENQRMKEILKITEI